MQSPVYWHPKVYAFVMKRLYGAHYESRYQNLSKLIPDNCNLLELCMGDLYFYKNYLKDKNVNYTCADVNPVFVKAAKREGVNAFLLDMIKDEIPKSDYILVQGSLYHAIPNHKELIKKLFASCNKQLIISENTNNKSNSNNKWISFIGAALSKARSGQSKIKFTKGTLKEAFSGYEKNIVQWIETETNYETIIVLQK